MIFVTVGTHNQPFNRLIEKVEQLKESGLIKEEVVQQIGYSPFSSESSKVVQFLTAEDMAYNVANARVVITHAGPGSINLIETMGRPFLIVPRNYLYGEHVDNHQVLFASFLESKGYVVVRDIEMLGEALKNPYIPRASEYNKYETLSKIAEYILPLCGTRRE